MQLTTLYFDTLDSTNTEAISQAKRGADEGLCVVADRQTAGRGRHGREWISPVNAGLYFSIVLRPTLEIKFLPLITLMSAVAVADILTEKYDLPTDIKWANDVQIGGKKICGILAELIETNRGAAVVVGIGINLKSENFPANLRETATSVEQEKGETANARELAGNLAAKLADFYLVLQSADGAAKIRGEWARRSSFFEGKKINVTTANDFFSGTTRGIEENGALRVETADGAIRIIQSGEVERVRGAE